MRLIRYLLGKIILWNEQRTAPTPLNRAKEAQQALNQITSEWVLYEFNACPYCVKVRQEIRRLNLEIRRVDAKRDAEHKKNLIEAGGRYQVPCLSYPTSNGVIWLYESDTIITFLKKQTA
ncbi:MAG: glutaredoxin domain-containing protein [Gammaproteobacteria bacterium]|nr:glutaredoxin domain-containing protein [Gammaproteobacteria bacterium]